MGDLPRLSEFNSRVRLGPAPILGLTKFAACLAVAKNDLMHAAHIAEVRFPSDETLVGMLKGAMNAGATTGTWGATLWQYRTLSEEFIAALRPLTIVGRLPNVRQVPFMIRTPRTTQSSTVGWVGQGLPKVVSELAFDDIQMSRAKIAGIVAIALELARSADPAALGIIQADLLATISKFVDEQFIGPANVAVSGVHPGSILAGVSGITSAGTSAANIVTDLNAAITALTTGGSSLLSLTWVMHPRTAAALALKRDSQNSPAFPGITVNGGMLAGVPVITSGNVPWSASGGAIIALLDQTEILLADGGVEIDGSGETSLQMDSAPSSSAATQTSLWQSNLFAVRAEREINWLPRHSAAATAAWIDAAGY